MLYYMHLFLYISTCEKRVQLANNTPCPPCFVAEMLFFEFGEILSCISSVVIVNQYPV